LTIVWNPSGFYVISVIPTGIKFNTGHYITDVLFPLAEWHKIHVGRTDQKLILPADNVRPDTATKSLDFL
jgi:hypothetical protein